jgi:hypothetical protein
MRLDFHYHEVSQVTFGDLTTYNQGTLTIHRQELVDHIAEDERLGSEPSAACRHRSRDGEQAGFRSPSLNPR